MYSQVMHNSIVCMYNLSLQGPIVCVGPFLIFFTWHIAETIEGFEPPLIMQQ